jgi:hypothetical protein
MPRDQAHTTRRSESSSITSRTCTRSHFRPRSRARRRIMMELEYQDWARLRGQDGQCCQATPQKRVPEGDVTIQCHLTLPTPEGQDSARGISLRLAYCSPTSCAAHPRSDTDPEIPDSRPVPPRLGLGREKTSSRDFSDPDWAGIGKISGILPPISPAIWPPAGRSGNRESRFGRDGGFRDSRNPG